MDRVVEKKSDKIAFFYTKRSMIIILTHLNYIVKSYHSRGESVRR